MARHAPNGSGQKGCGMTGQNNRSIRAKWRRNWAVWVVLTAWAIQGTVYWIVAYAPGAQATVEGNPSRGSLFERISEKEKGRMREAALKRQGSHGVNVANATGLRAE